MTGKFLLLTQNWRFVVGILFVLGAISSYMGWILSDEVKLVAYTWGKVDNSSRNAIDYELWAIYSSKDAFIANQNIHVKVRLHNNNHALDGRTLIIIFNPSYDSKSLNDIEGLHSFVDANVTFENISSERLEAETDIVYLVPGEQTFSIQVDNKPQAKLNADDAYIYVDKNGVWWGTEPTPILGQYFVSKKSKIHIAPAEDTLQIKINRILLSLTILMIYPIFIQILDPLHGKKNGK